MSGNRSAGRWCAECGRHGSHHTDRHEDFREKELNRRYNVNMGNPAPGFLDRAERALDDLLKGPPVFDGDDEQFCRRCLAGVHSSEHAEKCYYPGHAEMGESA